ncbi:MAG: hypothetical protein ACREOI_05895 [bacterium]
MAECKAIFLWRFDLLLDAREAALVLLDMVIIVQEPADLSGALGNLVDTVFRSKTERHLSAIKRTNGVSSYFIV